MNMLSWNAMFFTCFLTIAVTFLVAAMIHLLTFLISRFGSKAAPMPPSAVQEPILPEPTDPDELPALVIAIASYRRGSGKGA